MSAKKREQAGAQSSKGVKRGERSDGEDVEAALTSERRRRVRAEEDLHASEARVAELEAENRELCRKINHVRDQRDGLRSAVSDRGFLQNSLDKLHGNDERAHRMEGAIYITGCNVYIDSPRKSSEEK